jgi:hypothetical protein
LEKDEGRALELADVHMRLAEVHEESDNLAEAINEYERALALRRAHLEPHSRLIAEVYSCLAFDYSLEKRNRDALDAHHKAAECIEKRIAFLEDQAAASGGDKGKGKTEDVLPAATEEITELRAILEDLREKVPSFNHLACRSLAQPMLPHSLLQIDGLKDVEAEDTAVREAGAMFSPPSASPSAQPATDKPAAAAPLAGLQPAQVHHLGVFGRSKKIPFPPTSSTSSSTSSASSAEGAGEDATGKRKRSEERAAEQAQPGDVVESKSDEATTKKARKDE